MNYDFHSPLNLADCVRNGDPDRPNKGHDITIGKSRARFDAGIFPSVARHRLRVRSHGRCSDGVAQSKLRMLQIRLRKMFHPRLLHQAR